MAGSISLAYQDRICQTHAMKAWLTILVLVSFLCPAVASETSSKGRTISELNVIPKRVLQRSISAKFYKSLLISPVEGWITVRGQLAGTHLSGMRIVKSDLGGAYDALALKLASEVRLGGQLTTERPNTMPSVLLHLLIYKIADGTMALSFAHFDEPGGDQMAYYGCAKLAVLKSDGRWTQIDGPASLGTGWTVRQGPKNTADTLRMETMSKAAESTNMGAGHQ
jgi:hypothetical protein